MMGFGFSPFLFLFFLFKSTKHTCNWAAEWEPEFNPEHLHFGLDADPLRGVVVMAEGAAIIMQQQLRKKWEWWCWYFGLGAR